MAADPTSLQVAGLLRATVQELRAFGCGVIEVSARKGLYRVNDGPALASSCP